MSTEIESNKYTEALKNVIDPEFKIDIVNLGLIYKVDIDDEKVCTVTITLTIMGCPLSDFLYNHIREQLVVFDEIVEVIPNLVWEPAWSIKNMSREARYELGIFN
ncbi:metal-sulfur cluster assembly factor [Lactobacillaceae bacterium Melli_B4]